MIIVNRRDWIASLLLVLAMAVIVALPIPTPASGTPWVITSRYAQETYAVWFDKDGMVLEVTETHGLILNTDR